MMIQKPYLSLSRSISSAVTVGVGLCCMSTKGLILVGLLSCSCVVHSVVEADERAMNLSAKTSLEGYSPDCLEEEFSEVRIAPVQHP
jgi:hypothetical protein